MEVIDKATKKSENNALIALFMWLCAIVGAFVIKSFFSFVKWVFQK